MSYMGLGLAVALAAVGAVLYFAVSGSLVSAVGAVLMIVGFLVALGAILARSVDRPGGRQRPLT